ncbi:MAG: alanine racemase [Myxococcales bacterium]|nr:alanine racemase [Myxococcales bacterium]
MSMQATLRPTLAVIDGKALHHNVERVRAMSKGRRIMAILKANAYGHGLVPTAKVLLEAGVEEIGVAFLEEGILLRQAGIRAPILVLGGIIGNQILHFLEFDLMMAASSVHKVQQIEEVASRVGQKAKVHLKIDTGMGRIGVQWDTADQLVQAVLQNDHVEVVGMFSHLVESEVEDPEFTMIQRDRFESVVRSFERHAGWLPCRHLANSGAVIQHPETHYDMVRVGLSLYGVAPDLRLRSVAGLRPALGLVSRVVYFKVVREGRTVSYNREWTAERDTRVVTLPVGYGDGYSRAFSKFAQSSCAAPAIPSLATSPWTPSWWTSAQRAPRTTATMS